MSILLGFLLEPQRSRQHGRTQIACSLNGFPTGLLAEHIETQHASVAPVEWMNVIGNQIFSALAWRVHVEIITATLGDPGEDAVQFGSTPIASQCNRLDTRIEIL